MEATNVIIGIIMILTFLGMVLYCVKGFHLMIGFLVMSAFGTILALIGNAITPNTCYLLQAPPKPLSVKQEYRLI